MPAVGTIGEIAQDVADSTRGRLNDGGLVPAVYTNRRLLPYINDAYSDLQVYLAKNGISIMRDDFETTIFANQPNLPVEDLPVDFVLPWRVDEKSQTAGDRWKEMHQCMNGLPDRDPQAKLIEWEWIANELRFVGATQDVDIKVRYERTLERIVLDPDEGLTQPLRILGAVSALAARTAYYAVRARGNRAGAGDLLQESQAHFEEIVQRHIRPKQRVGLRRRPFSMRGKFSSPRFHR